MTSPYPTPPFTGPSPSDSSFSIPTTSEPVFSMATTEPVFQAQTSSSAQPSQNPQPQYQQYNSTTVSSSNAKFPYLKKEEYETWAMKMEYWIMNTDHNLWNIVLQGNAAETNELSTSFHHRIIMADFLPSLSVCLAKRNNLLTVKAKFGRNEESKKMRKSMLKQEFADFKITESEARPDNEDYNMKFLRALPPSWSQVAITLKTKGGLDFLSFDDLYNKLRTLKIDVKGGSSYDSRVHAAPTHSAFISAASTNSKESFLKRFFTAVVAEQVTTTTRSIMKTLTKLASLDLEETRYNGRWQCFLFESIDLKRRLVENSNLITKMLPGLIKRRSKNWIHHRTKGFGDSLIQMLIGLNHESEDMEKGASEVYGMIAGYGMHAGILRCGADMFLLLLRDAIDDEMNLHSWSYPLRSKFGLGYGDTFGSDEVFDLSAPSIFDSCLKDAIEKPLYDWFVKPVGMHAVPPPITGTFMPPSNKPDIDDTQFTYGSKSNNCVETNSVSNDFVSCDNSDNVLNSKSLLLASCLRVNNGTCVENVENIPHLFPKTTYGRAGSRNRPTSIPAGRSFPAEVGIRPTSVPLVEPFPLVGIIQPAIHMARRQTAIIFKQFSRACSYNQMVMDWEDGELPIKVGTVTFGGGRRKITVKAQSGLPTVNFEECLLVEELQNFKLFLLVSQILVQRRPISIASIRLTSIQKGKSCFVAKASLADPPNA
ncbi:hypothetical protein Tco_1549103 [Tanacetum coccineum]